MESQFKKNILLILIILLFCSCQNSDLPRVKVKIHEKIYHFEVAATSKSRQKGLMFRKKLPKDNGMLFVYPLKMELSFYMKNTLIPLDIAFLDEQWEIVDIRQMEPLDETSIVSRKPAQYALEVNQGFFDEIGLKVGDKIQVISAIPYVIEN